MRAVLARCIFFLPISFAVMFIFIQATELNFFLLLEEIGGAIYNMLLWDT